ncbi:MAG: InlB B-repeat-containing protein [Clostridia bacterium]|nr:InlB B-repeat-containing protein [Clostridia bacterium]
MKRLICLLFVVSLCVCLFGCGASITINTNGGQIENKENENLKIEEVINSTPTKDGFIFGGWYSDKELTQSVTKDSENLNNINNIYAKWITADSKEYDVRAYSATITDSGRKHQIYDIVRLGDDYDYQGLIYAGYTKFKVTFSCDISEQNDGYQYVFLYKNKTCVDISSLDYFISNTLYGKTPSNPTLLCSYRFEHTPGIADSSWNQYSFTSYINIEDLENQLYIRYGASGKYDDNWLNRNVILNVEPIK